MGCLMRCGRVPPLTVYNAYFFMALTFGFTAWGLNLALLYVPLCNGKESCLTEYARDHRGRIVSVAAGLACGVGMACQFLGGLAGGYAPIDISINLPPLDVMHRSVAFWQLSLFICMGQHMVFKWATSHPVLTGNTSSMASATGGQLS